MKVVKQINLVDIGPLNAGIVYGYECYGVCRTELRLAPLSTEIIEVI